MGHLPDQTDMDDDGVVVVVAVVPDDVHASDHCLYGRFGLWSDLDRSAQPMRILADSLDLVALILDNYPHLDNLKLAVEPVVENWHHSKERNCSVNKVEIEAAVVVVVVVVAAQQSVNVILSDFYLVLMLQLVLRMQLMMRSYLHLRMDL